MNEFFSKPHPDRSAGFIHAGVGQRFGAQDADLHAVAFEEPGKGDILDSAGGDGAVALDELIGVAADKKALAVGESVGLEVVVDADRVDAREVEPEGVWEEHLLEKRDAVLLGEDREGGEVFGNGVVEQRG